MTTNSPEYEEGCYSENSILTVVKNVKEAPCPIINKSKIDTDGIPFCPDVVLQYSANSVFRCAIGQSNEKLWTAPTAKQKQSFDNLLNAFYSNYTTNTKEHSKVILDSCEELYLECCRAKTNTDSYLLIYTKPGFKSYNGPFLMLREQNASNVIIISPHDGTDNTSIDTKLGFKNSKAFAVISNGHHKWNRQCDFCHTADTLGFYVLQKLAQLIKKPILLNIHGMIYHDFILRRSRSPELLVVFDKIVTKYVKRLETLNASFVIDDISTPYSLKTEIPVKFHKNRPEIIEKIIKEIELNTWAWGN
jgi:hypothetical protein